jgi:multidrug efflux pump subunit AcrA (membrane-fusion protein)
MRSFLSLAALVCVGSAVSWSCSSVLAQPPRFNAAPNQTTPTAVRGNELNLLDSFRIECLKKIEVAAQADGLIEQMDAEEGSLIPKDQLLFRIDNRVAKAQVDVAKKKHESAVKQAEQDADLRFAEKSHKLAKSEFEKELQVFQGRATSESSVLKKRLEAEKAELSIEVAKVKRETDALAAGVAEAELNAAMVQLGLYDIVAPWDAFVNERMKDQGAWIKAGEPILKIVQMSEMRVVGFVKLKDLLDRGLGIGNLEGARIQVTVDITPTQQHTVESVISFVSADVDNTSSVRVAARIRNERIGNNWLLRDGVPARVKIIVE